MPEPGVGRKSDKISSAAPVKKAAAKAAPVKSAPPAKDSGFLSGIKGIGSAIAAAPGNIARDVSMGVSAGLFSNRDKQRANLKATGKYTNAQINDYFARTDATLARNAAEAAARSNRSDDSPSAITPPPQDVLPPEEQMPVYRSPFGPQAPVQPSIAITPEMRAAALRTFEAQRGAGQIPYQMLPYQQGLGSMRRPGSIPLDPRMRQPVLMPIDPPDSRIFRLEPMSQPRMPVGQPQMNEMIRMQQADAAIRNQVPWYEQGPGVGRPQALPPQVSQPSQRQLDPYDGMRSIGMPVGQPQMPRIQPMPQPRMPQQNVSPAFQYAAQNYQRLGGSQRLMDRPIEMMSAAERRTINDMSRAMAEQAQQQQEYDMGRRMMGKGGGAIGSQLPSVMRTAMGAGLGNAIYGLPSLRPMTTSGTFRRPVGTTGTFRDYIS
jgi:hypothetical protein